MTHPRGNMEHPLTVSAHEIGVVRIFTTDLEPEGDVAITPKNVEKILGPDITLDPRKVEVFPAGMIEAMGLPAYLHEGHGIPVETMAGKAAVLEALSGLVILVPSSAFLGKALTLDPNPALRFIAAFEEERPGPPVRMATSASTDGEVPAPTQRSRTEANDTARSWIIALGALLAAAALVLFVMF